MNIKDIVSSFKEHQLKYGLNGDSHQQELYKWNLVTKQEGHPNVDAENFYDEIRSIELKNLCYSIQVSAYRHFAEYEPEEYRQTFKSLFNESIDLQKRVDDFISTCNILWDNKIKKNFKHDTSAMCDERLVSCFLTLRYPHNYTFYKNNVYASLCEILGVEQKKAGQKLVHYYELLKKYVIPVVEEDEELVNSVNIEVREHGYIQNILLIAQTALWNHVSKMMNMQKHNIWLFYYGENLSLWSEMIKDDYLSIYAWGEIGEIQDDDNKNSIKEKLIANVPEYSNDNKDHRSPVHSANMLYWMKSEMKVNDYVICINKNSKTIEAWGTVTSPYVFNSDHSKNNHRVGVVWNVGEFDITEILKMSKDSPSVPPRLQNVTDKDWAKKTILEIECGFQPDKHFKTFDPMKEVEILEQKKQIVLQGAPGTGKTYKTAAIAVAMCDGESSVPTDRNILMERYRELIKEKRIAFTTFHQSMDYEEFVEGIKPDTDDQETVKYKVKKGIFREICGEAQKAQITDAYDNFDEVWNKLVAYLDDNDYMDVQLLNGSNSFRVELNELGTGLANRTYPDDNYSKGNWLEGKSKFFNKEQLYNVYRGLPGIPSGGHDNYRKAIIKHLKKDFGLVEFKEGKTLTTGVRNYVLIIDEINRANISKVLGELITLLEVDKRLGEVNEIKVRLPYSPQEEFGVPSNLYIIGTMNTADRSVGYIDYAIRRRFAFITIKSDRGIVENYNSSTSIIALQYFDKVRSWMSDDNITGDVDAEDLMVGHSYFLADNITALKSRMLYEVIPLLREYINDGILSTDVKAEINEWEAELA